MRTNWVRERLLSGGSAIGCFMGLGSPNIAELMAQAGFDWLLVETEHNALDSAEIQHMLMAMNGTENHPDGEGPFGQSGVHSARAGHRRHGTCRSHGQDRR